MKKVIITSAVHPDLQEQLRANGYEAIYKPKILYEDLVQIVGDTEGLVVTTRIKIDKQLIDAAKELKWIGRLGSGMELIDAEYAEKKGIKCFSTPEGNSNAVAEHTLALVLNLLNKISASFDEVKKGIWLRNENKGTELRGKTVGIIGYGNTGSAFGRLLQPFNVNVLAHDKFKTGYSNDYIQESTLKTIFQKADIVSLHLPLTAETYHFASKNFFDSFMKKPFFITTCRGSVTDTESLIEAIKSNKVCGAALDVLENENFDAYSDKQKEQLHFLTTQPNVVVTPHIAGYSNEAFKKMSVLLLQKLGLAHHT